MGTLKQMQEVLPLNTAASYSPDSFWGAKHTHTHTPAHNHVLAQHGKMGKMLVAQLEHHADERKKLAHIQSRPTASPTAVPLPGHLSLRAKVALHPIRAHCRDCRRQDHKLTLLILSTTLAAIRGCHMRLLAWPGAPHPISLCGWPAL